MRIKILVAGVLLSTSLSALAIIDCGSDIGTCYRYNAGGSDTPQQDISCTDCCGYPTGDKWESNTGQIQYCANTPPLEKK